MTTDELAHRIGSLLTRERRTIAVAESLTGGLLVQALARTDGAGDWLRGGVVTYASETKRRVLDVTVEKVVSEQAAAEMASGVRRLLAADVSVAATGVAGPEPQDGEPPGTVWLAVDVTGRVTTALLSTAGEPKEICDHAVRAALRLLAKSLGEGFAAARSG